MLESFDILRKSLHEEFIAHIPFVIVSTLCDNELIWIFQRGHTEFMELIYVLAMFAEIIFFLSYSGFFISISLSLPVGYKIPYTQDTDLSSSFHTST